MDLSFLRNATKASIAALLLAGGLAACGDSGSGPAGDASPPTAARDARVAALVPSAMKGRTLEVATEASYAPMEFIGDDGRTIIGADPDLALAIGTTMGMPVRFRNVALDGIVAGVRRGRFDLGMSFLPDDADREREVDFVTYLRSGSSFYVPAGRPKVGSKADLCGRSVVVQQGTIQQDDAREQARSCPAGRKPGLLVLPDRNAVNLALASGRADVAIADTPIAAHSVRQSGGKLELSGEAYDVALYGIAIRRATGLARPVLEALRVLMANGTYGRILEKWGLTSTAVDSPELNGAGD